MKKRDLYFVVNILPCDMDSGERFRAHVPYRLI